ncbi:PilN domain-containing protein [Desulfopila inferna]|uniref:PilN domain-containing protein n=1 Tax=Desulfopila inferna TaxID=468528 RepID=UPI001962AD42|nr:PilN domain-containing protein [Desulfopila inferna]MBM9606294.1 PilN domain-containing protein [Desulfopila inferna]
MAQKLVSIDIREDVVCGVLLSAGGNAATVVGCGMAVRSEENSLGESIAEVLNHLGYSNEPCRVSLGAENFFYRNLSFPFHDKRKIDRILPIELEDTAVVNMGNVLVDSLVTGKKGTHSAVVAAMIDRNLLQRYLAELAELQLDPEIVAISNVQTALQLSKNQPRSRFVLLDAGCRRTTLYVMADGRMRLIRTMVFENGDGANFRIDRNSQQVFAKKPEKIGQTFGMLCKEIRHTLYTLDDIDSDTPLFLTGALADVPESSRRIGENLGCEVLPCDLIRPPVGLSRECGVWRGELMTAALALGIRSGRKQAGFNFRKDVFSRKASYRKYRKLVPRLGLPLLVIVLVAIGYLWNDYNLREKRLLDLKERGEEIFAASMPEVTRIVDPVRQLQVEITEMKKGMLGDAKLESDLKVLDLMAEISVRIPQSTNVHVVRMVADGNSVLLRGLTDNFNSVDSLKRVLERSSYFSSVTINSANLAAQSSDIRFELRLELRRG